MDRVSRIQELLKQKADIERELDGIRQQVQEEKAAFAAARKPRKPRTSKE